MYPDIGLSAGILHYLKLYTVQEPVCSQDWAVITVYYAHLVFFMFSVCKMMNWFYSGLLVVIAFNEERAHSWPSLWASSWLAHTHISKVLLFNFSFCCGGPKGVGLSPFKHLPWPISHHYKNNLKTLFFSVILCQSCRNPIFLCPFCETILRYLALYNSLSGFFSVLLCL